MDYVGFVIGARVPEDGWPSGTPFDAARTDSPDGPHWLVNDAWVGVFIAAFPKDAADALACGILTDLLFALPLTEDEVREYFDVEASNAQESWDAFRATSVANGFDPGIGTVMFVTGDI